MSRSSFALMAAALAASSSTGGLAAGPLPAPVAAGTPKDSIPAAPHKASWKQGWVGFGDEPKRRSLKERKARRAKRAQRSRR